MSSPSFDDIIHEQRGECLSLLPKGLQKFCSAGCSGNWYFDWIGQKYGQVEVHYGVELHSPKPADLPPEVQWIINSVADMRDIPTGEIDLLFSGQNVEHLFLDDLQGFFREANRVVTPGGYLVIDSPNRAVTQSSGYIHPQHTLEFTIEDAISLVTAAGFEVVDVRGIWSCVDGLRQWSDVTSVTDVERRISTGRDKPRDSFIWWLVSRKSGPCKPELGQTIDQIVSRFYSSFIAVRFKNAGHAVHDFEGTDTILSVERPGFIIYGPYVPLRKGAYEAIFDVKFLTGDCTFTIDVTSQAGEKIHATANFVPTDIGKWQTASLPFDLSEYTEGVEARMRSSGGKALARLGAQIRRI